MYPIYPTQIIHVNGENGARALQMAPNSNVLLLDDTAPLIWLAQTDGAGYKTVTPFKIEEYKPVHMDTIEERLTRLERLINEPNFKSIDNKPKQPATDNAGVKNGKS